MANEDGANVADDMAQLGGRAFGQNNAWGQQSGSAPGPSDVNPADTFQSEGATMRRARFCTRCGNPLEVGASFCARCGAPVAPVISDEQRDALPVPLGPVLQTPDATSRVSHSSVSHVQPVPESISGGQGVGAEASGNAACGNTAGGASDSAFAGPLPEQETSAVGQAKRAFPTVPVVVVSAVVSVAVIGAAIWFVFFSNNTTPSTSSVDRGPQSTASVASESAESSASSQPAAASLDEPEVRLGVNRALSYYVEMAGNLEPAETNTWKSFDATAEAPGRLTSLAFTYLYRHENDAREGVSVPTSEIGGDTEYIDRYNVRMRADRIEKTVERLYGTNFDASTVRYDGNQCFFQYHDGCVYTYITNGANFLAGAALADSMERVEGDVYKVTCGIYSNSIGNLFDIDDDSVYTSSPSELMQRYPDVKLVASAQATVRQQSDGRWTLEKFSQMATSDAAESDSAPQSRQADENNRSAQSEASQTGRTSQSGQAASSQANQSSRSAQNAQPASSQSDREKTAQAFALQYFTNITFPDPGNDVNFQSIGNWDVWAALVREYLEPGSAAADKFQREMVEKTIPGHGAAVFAKDPTVISSDGGKVTVQVKSAGTQNPYAGWSTDAKRLHVQTFTCAFADSGLISEYTIVTD